MRESRKRLLIRCDGGKGIGFGHIVRCISLAEKLRDSYNYDVNFAMIHDPSGMEIVSRHGFTICEPLSKKRTEEEGIWIKKLISAVGSKILVLDIRTDLAKETVCSIRESGVKIVIIDDVSDRRLLADLAFYPPVPQINKLDWEDFTGELYIGWEWVLLRSQFVEELKKLRISSNDRKLKTGKKEKNQRLLITMGGSDPAGLTLLAVDAIEQVKYNVEVTIIIGGGFMHYSDLSKKLGKTKKEYRLLESVENMASVMSKSDLAISSFGVTSYELAALKIPSLYICLTKDHAESARALSNAGFGHNLGVYTQLSKARLLQSILKAIEDNQGKEQAKNKLCEVDGLGAHRISYLINSLTEPAQITTNKIKSLSSTNQNH